MLIPTAAKEIAAAALASLPSGASTRDGERVAAGGALPDDLANRLDRFFANADTSTPEGQLAARLVGGEPMRRALSSRTSSFDALNTARAGLDRDLQALNQSTSMAVQAVVEMGWNAALERVGRSVTKALQDDRIRELPPHVVACTVQAAGVNPNQLIAGSISDATRAARKIWDRAIPNAETIIGDRFAVTGFSGQLQQRWETSLNAAETLLGERMQSELRRQLANKTTREWTPKDYTTVPALIISDASTAAAGTPVTGDMVLRDEAGRATDGGGAPVADGVFVGPVVEAMIEEAIDAHRPDTVTAAAVRREARISDTLRQDLAQAARITRRKVVSHTWHLNVHGPTLTEHFKPHVSAARRGVTITDVSELAVLTPNTESWPHGNYYYPGDHRYCACGWVASTRYTSA